MTVAPIPAGTLCADTDAVVTPHLAAALKAHIGPDGKRIAGVFRYLSRGAPQATGDLSAAEIGTIHGAGLGLGFVQHCPPPLRWWPCAMLGAQYGKAAVENARALGVPAGASIAVDIESPMHAARASDLFAYENAWSAQVEAAGYQPVLYLAQQIPPDLDAEGLYRRIRAQRYWRAAGNLPEVAVRGWCVRQSLPVLIGAAAFDLDTVCGDALGGVPIWWLPRPPHAPHVRSGARKQTVERGSVRINRGLSLPAGTLSPLTIRIGFDTAKESL